MTPQPVIELFDITRSFNTGDVTVRALKGISLTIHAGEFVAIMGTSGSGKSTLMYILGCLDQPSSGRYLFCGKDTAELDQDEIAGLRRDAFGFIFQSYNLIATASAVENVEMPAVYAGTSADERRTRAAELLTSLGLAERLDHRPNQLSGGQQQRVAIARALMNGGNVIFADEPTGALDSQSGKEVIALLKRLRDEGHTVVLITHDREVASHADRVIELRDGVIVADSGHTQTTLPAQSVPQFQHRAAAQWFVEGREALKMALWALRVNIFRTVLTLLGIVIGVASVVAMMAIGDGAKDAVMTRIGAMGTNLLLIRPGAPNIRVGGTTSTLTQEDAEAIELIPNVRAAVPEIGGGLTARVGHVDNWTDVYAISPDFVTARDWPLSEGAFISWDDVDGYAPVAVIGQTALKDLFPDGSDPIGQYVLLNNVPFQIIGTMSSKGATPWGSDQDDAIFVPVTTGGLRIFGRRFLRTITVLVDDLSQIDATQTAITDLLISRHYTEDFRIRNMASVVEAAAATQNTLTILLGTVGAISLLVGGIGVMNIMLVSVTERTREIGIRVANGARTINILQQFMSEAVLVSGLGGLIGAALGLAVALIIASLGTPITFSVFPVILAFSCAFLTGIVFGYMPARKAAHLDPVVALGAE